MPDSLPSVSRSPHVATSDRQRARDLLAAIRTLKEVEAEGRPATEAERARLSRFGGFGPLANLLFPEPGTGAYRRGGEAMGAELADLLTPEELASAKRSTFNAFYTSPLVMRAAFDGLARLGVPSDARVLEPGAGIGRFIAAAPEGMRFTGVELDRLSGRIARLLHPAHDIRLEDFADSRLPEGSVEAAVGNVPFADIPFRHAGQRFSLHDGFFAKALDALAPGGVLALVTSRFTLDKVGGAARDWLADRADLVGAIRLPDAAFREQGTDVVTDLVFLRKRLPGEAEDDPTWRGTAPLPLADGREATVNAWLAARPEMILGEPVLDRGRYDAETFKVRGGPDYVARLRDAVASLPEGVFAARRTTIAGAAVEAKPALTVPPGLQEGAFLVGPDAAGTGRALLQLECGELVPVTHGARPLTATDGQMGRRLAALIGLRDDARAVLKSQNEGRPDAEREAARRALNRSYERFVREFGPINKTTFSVNRQGTEVRRMPNLARFREDPDAVLVASLEEYDDATGRAAKAPILRQDVVGPSRPVERVASAEEGLLVSLNETGRVDLARIARLYGRDEDRITAELGDLLFHDPETGGWETRDAYLSGNVRRKLAAAEASPDPRHRRNEAALAAVIPEDLLPGDIDANLGAPWLPVPVIQAFTAELLGVGPDAISVAHLPRDAVWTLAGDASAAASVANTAEHGTRRIDGLSLIEQALNMKSPTIYDIVRDGDGEKRVLNQEETVAAREKQKRIKQRFASWVFSDPDRAEQLVRLYNDGFNNLRVREFDGSHLTFPGMNPNVTLRPHQVNAVWRNMADGNTLLALCVGSGKTFTMAATAMKLRQAGLVRKSVCVVPNHLLEQFGREFLHLYPNARLLIAGKEDLSKDRRRLLTAKIATGDWDAVLMTHSSFERIGMSHAFQERFFQEQIADYEALLIDAKQDAETGGKAQRNLIKQIEKRKAAYEEKLEALAAEEKKDDGLVFDDLGVDQVFYDEAAAVKNLSTATKMERVAGIQTEGSQRAFDMLMKSRFLDEQRPGRGLTFANGTPITNSMVEMYTLMRYLAPAMLAERGIAHFDAWAAAFGEVVDLMEISPDGSSLRPNSRFAKFVNLPELQQMFRSFADVQTADMLKLPVPALKGGKAQVVSCPMSEAQAAIQQELVARYEKIRAGGVDPRDDNALAITTDGRKLALDARLVDPTAEAAPDSKLEAMLDTAAAIWGRTHDRRGAQMVFCDFGVHPNGWGFSVYDEIKRGLEARGVPAREIADIGDAATDAKKAALFEKVRSGRVRFLLGSTAKMGTGTNVQERLAALHHLDAPWKPAEVEQRDGRILRQGNTWPEVEIHRYVTEGSFDAFMWQGLERKARFIGQVMTGKAGVRRADDIGGQELSFAEVKAIASGNPAVLTLAEIEAELQRLALLKRSHADDQYRARRQVRELPEEIDRLERRAAALEADHATAAGAGAGIEVEGRVFADRSDAVERLNAILKAELGHASAEPTRRTLGTYRGLRLTLETRRGQHPELLVGGAVTHFLEFRAPAAGALLNRVDHLVEGWPADAANARDQRALKLRQLDGYRDRLGQPFEQEGRLDALQSLRGELEGLLSGQGQEDARERIAAAVAAFQLLKDAPAPEPVARTAAEAEPELPPSPAAIVVPFPAAPPQPEPETLEPMPPPERSLAPLPRWAAKVRPEGARRQGSLFDQPRPVTDAPVRAEEGRTWRKAVGGKPVQLSLF